MRKSNSVSIGSSVEQNETQVPIGPHTQPREPVGDKNRVTNMALTTDGCAGLEKNRREAVRVW
jgi:hypothetical protein